MKRQSSRLFRFGFNLSLIIILFGYFQSIANAACGPNAQLINPNGLVFDNSNQNLYLANSGGNEVLEFKINRAANGTATGLVQINCLTTGLSNPTRLVFDTHGKLYLTNMGHNTVTVYGNNLTPIPGDTINSGIQRPLGIAIDNDNNLYVANNATNSIAVYQLNASGVYKQATYSPLTQDGAGNKFLAPGVIFYSKSANLLYVGLGPTTTQDRLLAYNTPLTATSIPVLNQPDPRCNTTNSVSPSGPTGMADTPTGNETFLSNYYNSIVENFSWPPPTGYPKYCVGTVTSSFPWGTTDQIQNPEGVAAHSFDEVYVSNSSAEIITEYGVVYSRPNWRYP